MTIPKHLVELCLRGFTSEQEAKTASPYPGNWRIEWIKRKEVDFSVIRNSLPSVEELAEVRWIELKKVSSVIWRWVPNHPDDVAIVREHQRYKE